MIIQSEHIYIKKFISINKKNNNSDHVKCSINNCSNNLYFQFRKFKHNLPEIKLQNSMWYLIWYWKYNKLKCHIVFILILTTLPNQLYICISNHKLIMSDYIHSLHYLFNKTFSANLVVHLHSSLKASSKIKNTCN